MGKVSVAFGEAVQGGLEQLFFSGGFGLGGGFNKGDDKNGSSAVGAALARPGVQETAAPGGKRLFRRGVTYRRPHLVAADGGFGPQPGEQGFIRLPGGRSARPVAPEGLHAGFVDFEARAIFVVVDTCEQYAVSPGQGKISEAGETPIL